jgi:3-isopropylmalate dehydrogenase
VTFRAGRFRLAVLPGDGVGPEVTRAALRVLDAALAGSGVELELTHHPIGGAAIDQGLEPLPEATLKAAREADAVFLGAVGGPRWDRGPARPEAGLLQLRRQLEAFANVRPVRVLEGLEEMSPLRPERVRGADIVFVRELTGGAYFGRPQGIAGAAPGRRAVDTTEYSEAEITRVLEVAFRLARERSRRVTSVDKANVLATSRLWREVAVEVGRRHPECHLEHSLVDSFALRLLLRPTDFDVVVTENLFGDILTDEAAALPGTLGMLPSASGGGDGPWLFEPVHGSAPDLAGRGIANPLGAILAVSMLLRLSLDRADLAVAVEEAVAGAVRDRCLTPDLGGSASTSDVAERVAGFLAVRA